MQEHVSQFSVHRTYVYRCSVDLSIEISHFLHAALICPGIVMESTATGKRLADMLDNLAFQHSFADERADGQQTTVSKQDLRMAVKLA